MRLLLSSQASLRREEATKWQEGECVQNKIIVYFEATQSPPPDSVGSPLSEGAFGVVRTYHVAARLSHILRNLR